jgi:uncharacterized membrane protein
LRNECTILGPFEKHKERPIKEVNSRARMILYTIAACIALVGLADAIYLMVAALTGEAAACGGASGCLEVLGSSYARVAGIPVATLGVVAYFAVFTFATLTGFGYLWARRFFALTVWAMFVMTLWLLYVQAFMLHAFCRYCLFSAAITFLLAGLVVASPGPGDPEEQE